MNINAKVMLAIRNFFKKYGKIILIIFIVWLGVFLVNMYLKNKPKEIKLSNTYNPDNPILDEGETVPTKIKQTANNQIDKYFNYCNIKDYASAFSMLTDGCKEYLYNNDVNQFKEYIDEIFTTSKIYNLQNYSNTDNIYIYNMKILDDITATGTSKGYNVYQEKIVIHDDNNELKISNQGYIGKNEIEKSTEDDYMKVKVLYKNMSYAKEEYTLEIRNRTENYLLISDNLGGDQITLNVGSQLRTALNTTNTNVIILPGEVRKITLLFDKYYDDNKTPSQINFNNVRILGNFNGNEDKENGSQNAIKTYSLNIGI